MQRTTLGTLMMSALFLAGCGGGGMGSVAPHTPNQTTTAPSAAGRHVKTLQQSLAAGELKAVCGPVGAGRARCVSYVVTPSGLAAAGLTMSATRDTSSHRPPAPVGLGPVELQSAYKLTGAANRDSDAVIAIVDAYDTAKAERDLAVYRAQYDLPPCTTANGCFRKVNQSGKPGPLPPPPVASGPDWTIETSLDLDMVSANCPRCKILLVESDDDFFNNLGAAVNTAAKMGAIAISNSYAGQESSTDPLPVSQQGLLPYYVHPGIAVVAANGDFGYSLASFNPNSYGPLIPAAFPSVVAVGGTELTRDADSARGWDETVWDGTGSGCSAYEPMPPWQKADPSCTMTDQAGNTTTIPSRIYGDVAYDASGYSPVAIYNTNNQNGGWGAVGGTSIGAPAIAAIYGLAGYGKSEDGEEGGSAFPARKLYASRRSLFDIRTGSNGTCGGSYLCTAVPGYDAPTGNGSPNGIGAF